MQGRGAKTHSAVPAAYVVPRTLLTLVVVVEAAVATAAVAYVSEVK